MNVVEDPVGVRNGGSPTDVSAVVDVVAEDLHQHAEAMLPMPPEQSVIAVLLQATLQFLGAAVS